MMNISENHCYDIPTADSEVKQPDYLGYSIEWCDVGFAWTAEREPGESCLWDYTLKDLYTQIDERIEELAE